MSPSCWLDNKVLNGVLSSPLNQYELSISQMRAEIIWYFVDLSPASILWSSTVFGTLQTPN